MVPKYGKEKGTKATMGLWCKLSIRVYVNDLFLENSANGGITLTNVTGNTVDILEYLVFGLYNKAWFKDNDGIPPSETVRWSCISHLTGRLMCYNILTQTVKVISRSTLHQGTNIELYTDEVKETFVEFDVEINQRIKVDNRGYDRYKPSPQYWANILEEDPDFAEDLKRV